MASEKQVAFIERLVEQRDVSTLDPAMRDRLDDLAAVTVPAASNLIALLKGCPQKSELSGPGMYRLGDDVFKVQRSGSGRLYAKRLVLGVCQGHFDEDGMEFWCGLPHVKKSGEEVTLDVGCNEEQRFEYEPGAIYRLTEKDRMTVDEARDWGRVTGVCCWCGITLTDPKSVAAGIGPVCAGRI